MGSLVPCSASLLGPRGVDREWIADQWTHNWRRHLERKRVSGLTFNSNITAEENSHQCRDGTWIQALAGQILDDADGFERVMRLLVRAICGERIECVSHGDHAWQQRNIVALQSIRISTPVQRLMMQFNAWKHFPQLRHGSKNVRTLSGVGLHDLELFRSQCAGFLQDAVFNADLPHVMQLG